MTIICRDDISAGYKCVQSAHALAEFAVKFEHDFKQWQMGSNYLCCLEASDRRYELVKNKLDVLKIKYVEFKEPDIENRVTAMAVEAISREQHKKLFKNLKLTLS